MEQPTDTPRNPDDIRSEIDDTRQRMDETIDALSERMKGRHLLDEVLGFFRPRDGADSSELKEKLTERVGSVVSGVTNTVKAHPVPTLLIGAGIAWMIYENRRRSASDRLRDEDFDAYTEFDAYAAFDRPGDYAEGGELPADYIASESPGEAGGVGLRNVRGTAGAARERAGEAARDFKSRAEERLHLARAKARRIRSRIEARSRELYRTSREQVATTLDERPIEVGLGFLALGVLAGLALPTHRKVEDMVGPRADALKSRAKEAGRDWMERGRQVVEKTTEAMKAEAEAQGLTPPALRDKAAAVASRGKDTAVAAATPECAAGPEGAPTDRGSPPPSAS